MHAGEEHEVDGNDVADMVLATVGGMQESRGNTQKMPEMVERGVVAAGDGNHGESSGVRDVCNGGGLMHGGARRKLARASDGGTWKKLEHATMLARTDRGGRGVGT